MRALEIYKMKCLCYQRPDGVAIGNVSQTTLKLMMEEGLGWSDATIEREISKHLIRTPADATAFQLSWQDFLAGHRGTPREAMIRTFCLGYGKGGLTEDQALAAMAAKDQPKDTLSTVVLERATLSKHLTTDRYFRNAVVWDPAAPDRTKVDMPKARGIHLQHIRYARDRELAGLDLLWLKAMEVDNPVEARRIAALKQTLRDIPQIFDLSVHNTPETLKAAWPAELPPRAV